MIQIKHLLDNVEKSDGRRIWVEPIGLTRDLVEWQHVSQTLTHVAPPRSLAAWFEEHRQGYEFFRGKYHEWLAASPYVPALRSLARAAQRENITLLHQGDDPAHNSATALYEFLAELEAQIQPDGE
jgi:uncharacterized protein YeaO (DUF488 family)